MNDASLRVTRGNRYFGFIRKLKVFVDDTLVGEVRANRTAEFSISPGRHQVYVEMDWCRSAPYAVDVTEGETVHLHVSFPRGILAPRRAMRSNPDCFFQLEQRVDP